MVYNRYFAELPHIRLRLEFMKLRNHTVPGLDEAAKAMFRAYEMALSTYHNPAGERIDREVDFDLYRLEKACWELIYPVGDVEYQPFPGKNPDTTAFIKNLPDKHKSYPTEPVDSTNAYTAERANNSATKSTFNTQRTSNHVVETFKDLGNTACVSLLSPSPQKNFQVQAFLEKKINTTNCSFSTTKSTNSSLVYEHIPSNLSVPAKEYVPPHMRFHTKLPISLPKPVEGGTTGNLDRSQAYTGGAPDMIKAMKKRQKERKLVPDVKAIGRILNHDLCTK